MKKMSWIIVLLTAGLARAEEFTFTGQARVDEPVLAWLDAARLSPVGDRVRVASYNIEHFTDGQGDDPDRTQEWVQNQARRAAEFINEMNPDVLLLMETENTNSLNILNGFLKPPFATAYITRLGDGTGNEEKLNLAVLSRLPVTSATEVDFGPLSGPGRPTRGFLRAIMDLGDQHRLVVYAVHLKSNFGHRPRNIAQRVHTMEMIAENANALVQSEPGVQWEMLVAGDTNVDPELPEFAGDPSLKPLNDWKDLWRGRPLAERTTLPTRYGDPKLEFPPACFDRLFASSALTSTPWQVGEPQAIPKGVDTRQVNRRPGDGEHVSDHYPIYVDVIR